MNRMFAATWRSVGRAALVCPSFLGMALAGASVARAIDSDGDAVDDPYDNCALLQNTDQTDADFDDIGNACDGDFDQNGASGTADFGVFRSCFGKPVGAGGPPADPTCAESDMDGKGFVGISDYGYFLRAYGQPLGPAGAQVCCMPFSGDARAWLDDGSAKADQLIAEGNDNDVLSWLVQFGDGFQNAQEVCVMAGAAADGSGPLSYQIRDASNNTLYSGVINYRSGDQPGLPTGWNAGLEATLDSAVTYQLSLYTGNLLESQLVDSSTLSPSLAVFESQSEVADVFVAKEGGYNTGDVGIRFAGALRFAQAVGHQLYSGGSSLGASCIGGQVPVDPPLEVDHDGSKNDVPAGQGEARVASCTRSAPGTFPDNTTLASRAAPNGQPFVPWDQPAGPNSWEGRCGQTAAANIIQLYAGPIARTPKYIIEHDKCWDRTPGTTASTLTQCLNAVDDRLTWNTVAFSDPEALKAKLALGPFIVLLALDDNKKGAHYMVAVGTYTDGGTEYVALTHGWDECYRAVAWDTFKEWWRKATYFHKSYTTVRPEENPTGGWTQISSKPAGW